MEVVFIIVANLLIGLTTVIVCLNGKKLTIQFFVMVGEKKTEKSIGFFKTVGEANGERVETSE